MTELRELTDAELDTVAGGLTKPTRPPTQSCGGGIEELIVDILKVLEGNGCNSGPVKVRAD